MDYAALVARSRGLPYAMPTEANRLERLADRRDEVEAHAAGVRPILRGDVVDLIEELLEIEREVGSPAARALYADLGPVGFVTRLLARRPLAFLNPSDAFLLRDGARGSGGFERIGSADERPPLVLEELLSYDEMPISALLGVSVPTHFVNAGARDNRGRPGAPGSFEPRGVYVGLVGARFEVPGRMEWRHCLVTPGQNTAAAGYGPEADPAARATRRSRAWARFYGREHLPLHAEAAAAGGPRYLPLGGGRLLDVDVYRRRIRASVEVFLREGDARARAAGRPAYLHAVGLGLGVWQIDPRQVGLMVDVYAEVLRELLLPGIADLDFSWFGGADVCGGVRDGEVLRAGENAVRIHFSRRDPAAPLRGGDAGKVLVAMYAWDANAFPGNEYWLGALAASGDPAAACCSTIPELQNPDVNPRVAGDHALVFPAGGGAPRPLAG